MVRRLNQGVCVLSSGGVESCILLHYFARKGAVYPLYIRSGYVWEKAELEHLKRFLAAVRRKNIRLLRILDFPLRDIQPSHWGVTGRGIPGARSEDKEVELPGRNLFLLSLASAFSVSRGIHRIALGTLSSNPFPDATPAFFGLARRVLGQAFESRIEILTPFSRLKKSQVIERYGKGLPLQLTFSCLNPQGFRPCFRCNKCAERKKAISPQWHPQFSGGRQISIPVSLVL